MNVSPQADEQSPASSAMPPLPAPGEGCPPPLAWADVVAQLHAEAPEWECPRPNGAITGRTFGDGPPLYLLPGLTGNSDLLALLTWLLRDQFCCVLIDYPPRRRRVTELVDDLLAVLDQHGHTSCALFATSFGSLIALEALAAHPARFSAAILQAGYAHRHLSLAERGLIRLGAWLPLPLARLPGRAAIQQQNHRHWFPPLDPTRWQFYLKNTGETAVSGVASRAALIRRTDLRSRLPLIKQPVLLIEGEGDGAIARHCQQILATHLPHAQTESLHTTGQIPYLTHPHRIAKLVKAFLGE